MTRLHPLSAVIGAAIVGLCLLTMSQMRVAAAVIGVEYLPHPRDMVQIVEGTPYTVPAGKILVITGLGTDGHFWGSSVVGQLKINGQQEAITFGSSGPGSGSGSSVVPMPAGLTAAAGSVVEVTNGTGYPNYGRAWGYLAAQ